jgi:hypothetical protein
MRHFFDWFVELGFRDGGAPWLILGKGPTYARRGEYDLTRTGRCR